MGPSLVVRTIPACTEHAGIDAHFVADARAPALDLYAQEEGRAEAVGRDGGEHEAPEAAITNHAGGSEGPGATGKQTN